MYKKIAIFTILSSLCFSSEIYALRIGDSVATSQGTFSTLTSLNSMKKVSTYGAQNMLGIPVGTIVAWPSGIEITTPDRFKYRECDGSAYSKDDFPELFAVLGVEVLPNLNTYFLRSTTDTSLVLNTFTDSIASHTSIVPPHKHEYDGELADITLKNGIKNTYAEGQKYVHVVAEDELSVVGTAAGQEFTSDEATWPVVGTAAGQAFSEDADLTVSGTAAGQKFSGSGTWDVSGTAAGQLIHREKQSYEKIVYSDLDVTIPQYSFTSSYGYTHKNDSEFNGSHHVGTGLVTGVTSSSSTTPIKGPFTTKFGIEGSAEASNVTGSVSGTISGTASSSTVTGTASGTFSGTADSSEVEGSATGTVSGTAEDSEVTGDITGTLEGTNFASKVVGELKSGKLKRGTTETESEVKAGDFFNYGSKDGSLPARYTTTSTTGTDETAPKHILVRYYIKVIP